MPFPTTPILDTFTRSDAATLGSAWTDLVITANTGGFGITSNAATHVTGSPGSYWNGSTFGADCEVYATVFGLGGSAFSERMLYARITSPNTGSTSGYAVGFEVNGGLVYLYRITSSGYVDIGTPTTSTLVAGNVIGLSVIGTTVTAYINGTAVNTVTDSTYGAAGFIGIGGFQVSPATSLRNFGGGTVSGGGSIVALVATALARSRSSDQVQIARRCIVTERTGGRSSTNARVARRLIATERTGGRSTTPMQVSRQVAATGRAASRSQALVSFGAALVQLIATGRSSSIAQTAFLVNRVMVANARGQATGRAASSTARLLTAQSQKQVRGQVRIVRVVDLRVLDRSNTTSQSRIDIATLLLLVATAIARSRSTVQAQVQRTLSGTGYARAAAQSAATLARALGAQSSVRSTGMSGTGVARALSATGRIAPTGQSSPTVARVLMAQVRSRGATQALVLRAVGLQATGRSSAVGTSTLSLSALLALVATGIVRSRSVLQLSAARALTATDQGRAIGQSAPIVNRALVAANVATMRASANLVRAILFVAMSRTSNRPLAYLAVARALAGQAYGQAKSASYFQATQPFIALRGTLVAIHLSGVLVATRPVGVVTTGHLLGTLAFPVQQVGTIVIGARAQGKINGTS